MDLASSCDQNYKKFDDFTIYFAASAAERLQTDPPSSAGFSPLLGAVLIANRGEIAVRIIATLKRLGIKAIAVYSYEDRESQHVREADASYILSGRGAEETYLSEDAIIKIAKEAKADAIIPGYGFLSESASFAEKCEAEGLTWVGPTPQQMRSLGLKEAARKLAQERKVPLLPGTGLLDDVEIAIVEAARIGYPVMVKSNAGGGGIGLQKCQTEEELKLAIRSVQHLGQSYFNDSSLFIEKFIECARHVEIQIIGDGKGRVCHAGDRDCSLQRRRQKVIEESPAVLVPNDIRISMRDAALNLTASVYYRGVGTVEFIYDVESQKFYFLEVNTRLQVEHPVTEATLDVDLVEIMLQVAAGERPKVFDNTAFPKRVALEARIYGESPLQNFRPSPGQLTHVSFPQHCRVDTWVQDGTQISSMYDPLLAKLIVTGYDRPDAVRALSEALDTTIIGGIETNISYLKSIVKSFDFASGSYHTISLETFDPHIPAFEIIEPGPATSVQDYPGRTGFWHVGIPPSGPMDSYSLRLANRLLGNDLNAAGLECTSSGPKLLFHADSTVAVVGASGLLTLDDSQIPYERPVNIKAGQTLELGSFETGSRAYIAVQGGLDIPNVMNSKATFAMGNFGGHCGRNLRIGDIIHYHESRHNTISSITPWPPLLPAISKDWSIRVIAGPHGAPDFFTEDSYKELFEASWKVHYNSNRVGVRLTGPIPRWARETGGEAGFHPSNIHDSPYSIGAISFTGDEAVILGNDGPSLGGFVVFAVVVEADLWKIGQMRAGDEAHLVPITFEEAMRLSDANNEAIFKLSPSKEIEVAATLTNPVIGISKLNSTSITCRYSGDRAILLEFGENVFEIDSTTIINALIKMHEQSTLTGVLELTPGVRSVHIIFDPEIMLPEPLFSHILQCLECSNEEATAMLPSYTFRLPLAIDHPTTRAALERYSRDIRAEAPWLPSNLSFLQRVNGLPEEKNVLSTIFNATYLVLGLGDVFFGSPCAIPLDPRQRLFSTKYNPSRSWTAEGTVGIGGQYLCIYAIDSPGGYQLLGRTCRIWDRFASIRTGMSDDRPWLFNYFDQIRFYPIEQDVLDRARANGTDQELIIVDETPFNVAAYKQWLKDNHDDIERVRMDKWEMLRKSQLLAEAMKPPPISVETMKEGDASIEEAARKEGAQILRADVPGKCWRVAVTEGDIVEEGQDLVSLEAMKMEVHVKAPFRARCTVIFAQKNAIVDFGSPMVALLAL